MEKLVFEDLDDYAQELIVELFVSILKNRVELDTENDLESDEIEEVLIDGEDEENGFAETGRHLCAVE